jgi:hypothetical protein
MNENVKLKSPDEKEVLAKIRRLVQEQSQYKIAFSDEDVIKAYTIVVATIKNTDCPTLLELDRVREQMGLGDIAEILCLNWLRNKIVYLRKAGRMPKQGKRRT